MQQLLTNTTPAPGTSSSAGAEPVGQLCDTAAPLVSRDVSPAVDRAPVQEFAGLLEPTMELPNLCSMESSDSFWKDILENSYRF